MYQKYVFMKLKILTGLLTGLVVSASTTALFCQPSRAGNNNFFCGTLPYISTGILNPEPVFNERILINTSVRLLASAQVDVGVKVSSASVATDPKAEAFFIQGNDKYEKGDYQAAIAAYSQAIVLNPNYVEAYNRRGNARRGLGDNKGALADYNEAVRINPNYHTGYYNRGVVRSELGDKQGAVADFSEARAHQSSLGLRLHQSGTCLL